jgi:hypothetical protein
MPTCWHRKEGKTEMPRLSYLQRVARQFSAHAPVLAPIRPLFRRGETGVLPPVGVRRGDELPGEPASAVDAKTATCSAGSRPAEPAFTPSLAPPLSKRNPLTPVTPAEANGVKGAGLPPTQVAATAVPSAWTGAPVARPRGLERQPAQSTEPNVPLRASTRHSDSERSFSEPMSSSGLSPAQLTKAAAEPSHQVYEQPLPGGRSTAALRPPGRNSAIERSSSDPAPFSGLHAVQPARAAIEPSIQGHQQRVQERQPTALAQPPRRKGLDEHSRRGALQPEGPAVFLGATAPPLASTQPETAKDATVQIGSIDIHITPAAPPQLPAARSPPPLARPAPPAAPLARGFTSPFGLRQG